MTKTIILIIVVCTALLFLKSRYSGNGFKDVGNKKPKLVFFPKYQWKVEDEAALRTKLEEIGFSVDNEQVFRRGKKWGDFSIKLIPLCVRIDSPKGLAMLESDATGVFFDTGDLWMVANQLKNA